MLVPILLSLLWGLCSTVLIHPWFWRNVFIRRTLIGDEKYRGWEQGKEYVGSIIMNIVYFIMTFGVSWAFYKYCCVRWNIYGSILPILLAIVLQCFIIYDGYNSKRRMKALILVGIGIVISFFTIADSVVAAQNINASTPVMEVPLSISTSKKENMPIINSLDIKTLFKADTVSYVVYTNGKFLYGIEGQTSGTGIVVIDERNSDKAFFVPCKFKAGIITYEIRTMFPVDHIKYQSVVINESNVPFGKYFIINAPFFGRASIKEWFLSNLQTGEITRYSVESLPDFAK
jgi:hypothetical protein